ncbi:MAG: hypothetical protein CM1200mP41_18970 [Gammaproteobacteria bacterium]|nr:MAG: hypothetical protein CM1200mP41_18970 [Gammaproteobacteria bacterium]
MLVGPIRGAPVSYAETRVFFFDLPVGGSLGYFSSLKGFAGEFNPLNRMNKGGFGAPGLQGSKPHVSLLVEVWKKVLGLRGKATNAGGGRTNSRVGREKRGFSANLRNMSTN